MLRQKLIKFLNEFINEIALNVYGIVIPLRTMIFNFNVLL